MGGVLDRRVERAGFAERHAGTDAFGAGGVVDGDDDFALGDGTDQDERIADFGFRIADWRVVIRTARRIKRLHSGELARAFDPDLMRPATLTLWDNGTIGGRASFQSAIRNPRLD